jgi:hypothetical protein
MMSPSVFLPSGTGLSTGVETLMTTAKEASSSLYFPYPLVQPKHSECLYHEWNWTSRWNPGIAPLDKNKCTNCTYSYIQRETLSTRLSIKICESSLLSLMTAVLRGGGGGGGMVARRLSQPKSLDQVIRYQEKLEAGTNLKWQSQENDKLCRVY